jgi:hypothetical protein
VAIVGDNVVSWAFIAFFLALGCGRATEVMPDINGPC